MRSRKVRTVLVGFVPYALVVMFAASTACPPKPPPAPPTPIFADAGVAVCPNSSVVSSDAVCDGFFTQEGFACVRCVGNTGCLDKALMIYCAGGGCANDPACKL